MLAYVSPNDSTLCHHGVKGQRWYHRRYQNKDGSLTPAGKKRAAQLRGKYESLTGEKMGESSRTSKPKNKSKSISEMSNEEIQSKIDRIDLENKLRSRMVQPPSRKEKAVEFAKGMVQEVVQDAGKKYVKKMVNKSLGLDDKDPYDVLKKTADTLEQKKRVMDAKEYIKNFQDKTKSDEMRRYAENAKNYQKAYEAQEYMRKEQERKNKEAWDRMKAADTIRREAGKDFIKDYYLPGPKRKRS